MAKRRPKIHEETIFKDSETGEIFMYFDKQLIVMKLDYEEVEELTPDRLKELRVLK